MGELGSGSESQWTPRAVGFFEHSGSVKEVDCGSSHTLVCTKDGEVYTWGRNMADLRSSLKSPVRVELKATRASQVGAGDCFSMALSEDGKKVFVWGYFRSMCDTTTFTHPTECQEVTDYLKAHNTTIVKMKVSAEGVAFLTAEGKLLVWGDNKNGQLANNHMKEDINDTVIAHPTEIYPSYSGRIIDFDLSDNMLVFLTDAGEVYFAGLWKYFVPFKCHLPAGVKPKSVGAAHDGFGVVDGRPA
jgi:alpha-tubulin suppressor-like RCC1 family protein